MSIINRLKVKMLNESYSEDVMYSYMERYDDKLQYIVRQFRKSKQGDTLQWDSMNPSKLIQIWKYYSKFKIVKDDNDLDDIVDFFIDKIVTIDVNTAILGHTSESGVDVLRYAEIDSSEEEIDRMSEFLVDSNGQMIISDYALNNLRDYAYSLLDSKSSEDKLLILDKILNTIHQRSDLASYFIQGGRATLDYLHND